MKSGGLVDTVEAKCYTDSPSQDSTTALVISRPATLGEASNSTANSLPNVLMSASCRSVIFLA